MLYISVRVIHTDLSNLNINFGRLQITDIIYIISGGHSSTAFVMGNDVIEELYERFFVVHNSTWIAFHIILHVISL